MRHDNKEPRGIVPIALILIAMVVAAAVVNSCCPKIIERVETKVEYRDRLVHDTTKFEVPVEVEKIVTRDTSSHLENRWAKSDAMVSDGFLSHSLESIPQVVKVPFEVEVHDTTYVQTETVERVKEVKVAQPLTWWQKFRQEAFWWLAGAVVLLLVWAFRKWIFKI